MNIKESLKIFEKVCMKRCNKITNKINVRRREINLFFFYITNTSINKHLPLEKRRALIWNIMKGFRVLEITYVYLSIRVLDFTKYKSGKSRTNIYNCLSLLYKLFIFCSILNLCVVPQIIALMVYMIVTCKKSMHLFSNLFFSLPYQFAYVISSQLNCY